MRHSHFTELEIALAVARHASFRAAAQELAISATAASSAVAALEARLAVRLFHRTTRSVALTEAGRRYLERVAPALAAIRSADQEAASQSGEPSGTLRINAAPETAGLFFESLLLPFALRYPGIKLDLVSERRKIDIVAEGFDAGIRLAENVPQDMIAVPLTRELRMIVVASPGYLARRGVPRHPDELQDHEGIYMRFSHGGRYLWELAREGQQVAVDIPARMVFGEMRPVRDAARAGLGLAFLTEWLIAGDLADGTLVPVLPDWCPVFPGLCLYYAGRHHVPDALRAFIDMIHELRLADSWAKKSAPD